MNSPTVKPCPFCGAPGQMLGSADKGWHVWCTGDEDACSPSPMTHIARSPAAAAKYWNKRVAAAVDWRPIADAPQDGTRLMLWDSESKRPVFGSWRPDSAHDHGPITHFAAEPAGPEVP
ncbi:Lar family restriction alleviation protein [Stenotrophomonas maltophilia]|uniref:Lar family restriction alleviation protein n=1 Tax=Stenotrophomonas maltophilia TaxID=40324 RepID=UPI001313AAFC|nr:Lar family restriction alleviation protein [Stenotrophomonas maltophilia]